MLFAPSAGSLARNFQTDCAYQSNQRSHPPPHNSRAVRYFWDGRAALGMFAMLVALVTANKLLCEWHYGSVIRLALAITLQGRMVVGLRDRDNATTLVVLSMPTAQDGPPGEWRLRVGDLVGTWSSCCVEPTYLKVIGGRHVWKRSGSNRDSGEERR